MKNEFQNSVKSLTGQRKYTNLTDINNESEFRNIKVVSELEQIKVSLL